MMRQTKIVGGILLLSLTLLLGMVSHAQQPSVTPAFYFGVDLSYVNEMDDCGAVYRENGETKDAFALFAEHGATLVRARLWNNPDWTDYSTLDDVKRTFTRAQENGMSTLLDFHYSDNWADPGRQEIPAAWEDIQDDDELAAALYQYTYDVMTDLHAAKLTPDFVQVGNETNSGMLKQIVELDWERDAKLFNAGIQAIRDFSAEAGTQTRILLHIAQPENTGWWFSEAEAAGITDFDIIGISYYPQWSTFSIAQVGSQVSYLRQRFGKDVMILETGYPWTREAVNETADNILNQGIRGYSFTPAGQRQFMTDLTQSLISNGGLGVVYWEPAWVSTDCSTRWGQGSHWENATFFNFLHDNNVHEGIEFLNADYLYPQPIVDGVLEPAYGDSLVQDDLGDVVENRAALDWQRLHIMKTEGALYLTVTLAGNIYDDRGNYLFYLDTIENAGATENVDNRPITPVDAYQPEYRLDLGIVEQKGTVGNLVVLNTWIDVDWQKVTFTGGVTITNDEDASLIEIEIPLSLLNNPDHVNLAVVSTDQTRLHTAADVLGSSSVPSAWDDPISLDAFFSIPLN